MRLMQLSTPKTISLLALPICIAEHSAAVVGHLMWDYHAATCASFWADRNSASMPNGMKVKDLANSKMDKVMDG